MPITIDLSATEHPESVGEFRKVAVGPVHLLVQEIRENGGNGGEHVVKFEVLMHNDPSQVAMIHTENFPASAEMAWKILGLAYATKIADREKMAQAKASGNNYVPIELQQAVGRQLFGTIKANDKTKDGKTTVFHNLTEMLAIDDEKAKNHPRNVGMLQMALRDLGAVASTSGGGGSSASAAGQSAPDPFSSVG